MMNFSNFFTDCVTPINIIVIQVTFILFKAQQPYSGLFRINVEVSRSHTGTSHSAGILLTRNWPFGEIRTSVAYLYCA